MTGPEDTDAERPDAGDSETPEQAAARTRSSAQDTARDLARMGIDPRALGLDDTEPTPGAVSEASVPPAPPSQPLAENVVPLRPESSGLPASGTSAAWAPRPTGFDTVDEGADIEVPGAARRDAFATMLAGGEPSAAPDRGLGRLARAVMFGVVTPDAAEAAEREREMVARVRTRQGEQRIIAFLAGKGGEGTTTVTTGVGAVLASLRDDKAAVVSLRAGAPSLGRLLTGQSAPSARELSRSDTRMEPLALPNGLVVVDAPRWSTPLRRDDVPMLLDALAQQATFALVDIGNDTSEAAQSVLARADQIVVVAGAGNDSAEAARIALERVAELDPYAVDAVIHVVVCRREAVLKDVVRRMRSTLPSGARIVAVPPEPSLADGVGFDPQQVGVATRLAMIDVAGLVALGSRGGSRGGG